MIEGEEEFRVTSPRALPAETLRGLTALSPARASLSLLANFGVIAGWVALAVSLPHPAVVALAVIGIAAAQHGLAVLTHQAAHYRMYRSRWLNDFAGALTAMPMGFSLQTYRLIHRTHHNHLYEPIDPDLALMAGYPRGRLYLAKKLMKDLLGVTNFKNFRYFSGASLKTGPSAEVAPALRRARRDQRIAGLAYLSLFGASIATGTWGWFLLLWALPLVTVLQLLLRLRAVCEHGAVPDTTTPLRAARTTLAPWWIRWLLFPHHVQYHIEHHLFPAVPHYRLRACHRALLAAGILTDAEVVPSLAETLRKIFAEPRAPRAEAL
jgi:fatty acid desaturase